LRPRTTTRSKATTELSPIRRRPRHQPRRQAMSLEAVLISLRSPRARDDGWILLAHHRPHRDRGRPRLLRLLPRHRCLNHATPLRAVNKANGFKLRPEQQLNASVVTRRAAQLRARIGKPRRQTAPILTTSRDQSNACVWPVCRRQPGTPKTVR
jgi:hypothetical protein